jgi:hypothetical protein
MPPVIAFRIVAPLSDSCGATWTFLEPGAEPRPAPVIGCDGVARLDYSGSANPVVRALGQQLHVVAIGEYALEQHGRWIAHGDPRSLAALERQAAWLAHEGADRTILPSVTWPFRFAYVDVPAPWVSGMAQALAASTLARASVACGRPAWLDLAVEGLAAFDVPVESGGVRSTYRGRVCFEEYPAPPWRGRCFNGFLVALLGLMDVARLAPGSAAGRLLDEGLASLDAALDDWDLGGWWSITYPVPGLVATPDYHRFHIELLALIGRLASHPRLLERAARWQRAEGRPWAPLTAAGVDKFVRGRLKLGRWLRRSGA